MIPTSINIIIYSSTVPSIASIILKSHHKDKNVIITDMRPIITEVVQTLALFIRPSSTLQPWAQVTSESSLHRVLLI